MTKIKWVKQLTRENTLLDRSLRAIAYRDAIKEIGAATISNMIIVGHGRVTSLYYDADDYKHQQNIIISEYRGADIEKMSKKIFVFLEEGYKFAYSLRTKNIGKKELISYYKKFNKHHAHARGAILYGYWGEPIISAKLKKILRKKVAPNQLDHTLSVLSAPTIIAGDLRRLYHPSLRSEKDKAALVKKLSLGQEARELVEILSWFTLFYEIGERVASYLYNELLNHLKRVVSEREFEGLVWYDPIRFEHYLSGKRLSAAELRKRMDFWILIMIKGKWRLFVGKKAKKYFKQNLTEQVSVKVKEFKGTIACLGKAKGRVKIIITQADQIKMKSGDILVSTMTTPKHMASIRKAAAIVTDEGGMTAHAAIVAREMNIPCVIGTKIATHVLKDGDLVEVDANKGIIKKL